MKKEIERLNSVIRKLEDQLLLICEMYYDDKDTTDMMNWINMIKRR